MPRPATPGCGSRSSASSILYVVVGVTTILVLRGMSRRWRAAEELSTSTTSRTARRGPIETALGQGPGPVSWADVGRRRAVLRRHRVRDLRRRGLRRRLLGSHRRWRRTGRAAARHGRPLDRPGVGGEPRLADLLSRGALDRVRLDVRVDHADAVRAAHAGRVRHRAARLELRVPQGRVRARATAGTSAPRSRCRRCSCRSAWARWPVRSRPGGSRREARPATRGTAGSTRRRSSAVCSPSSWWRTWPPSTSPGTPGGSTTTEMVEYFRRRAIVAAVVAGRGRVRRDLRAPRRRARTCSTG